MSASSTSTSTSTSIFAKPVFDLACELLARPSLTPNDAGCLDHLATRFAQMGFVCERMDAGPLNTNGQPQVANLWAKWKNDDADAPTLIFAGHTDVVPVGDSTQWQSDPFSPTVREGILYARGAVDMKSSLAAMWVACEQFLQTTQKPSFNLAFLLTSDEEGPAVFGTKIVCDALQARGERLDWCVVGEPTSVKQIGDTLKNGRRGSLNGRMTVHGIQGHIAYPRLAKNPIHAIAPALTELIATEWDQGNAHFPATTFQISNFHSGTGATNVIPGTCVIDFNFRFCTENTAQTLQDRVWAILKRHGFTDQTIDLAWTLSAQPFLTPEGSLVRHAMRAIKAITHQTPTLSTTGGTSDGRFIAPICREVIELGPCNRTAHKIDEHIALHELTQLAEIYYQLLLELQAAS